jgi:hypothetical protein
VTAIDREALLELVESSPTLERIASALERIADAFERQPEPGPCAHPVEARSDYSTMGHAGRFVCDPAKGGCGFRNF